MKKKRSFLVKDWKSLHSTWTVRLAVVIGVLPQIYVQAPALEHYVPLAHLTSFLSVLLILGRALNQAPAK